MQLRPVPLFGIGNAGKSVNVTAQERLNLYVEVKQDDEGKHILALYGTPGLVTFVNFGARPIRGAYKHGTLIYAVYDDKLYSITNAGTTQELGTLNSTSGRVNFSDNGTEIILVDGDDGYIWDTVALTFNAISDVDFPGADTVTFLNGRFIVNKPGTGEFYWSGLYDGTTWDALDFANAESNPDNLVAVIAELGQLVLMGDTTTEFWGDSGGADSPYARVGSSATEWGLAAPDTLCKHANGLAFLGRNRSGQIQAAMLRGYQAQAISNPDMDTIFASYGDVSNATGFSYMFGGHAFFQLNFPTVGKSWLYDAQSNSWSRLESSGGRHRANLFVQLLGNSYVADYANGKLYRIDPDIYTDDGAYIARELIGRHQANGNRMTFNQLCLEFEPGVGLQQGQGADPQVMLQVSRDGGKTYGAELWRSIGRVGKYLTRAVWNRLGQAYDFVFKFRITDPVKVVIIAAWGNVK